MATGQTHVVLCHLRKLAASQALDAQSDGQLLERFVAAHEEEAFAALVRRHGPLVLGVCRRLLRGADAEDAFQATFIVLFRRARSLDRRGSLAGWLYTVAYHVALRARAAADRRRLQERRVVDMPRTECHAEAVWRDLQPVLDDELNRLPEKYRAPVLLCYVAGKTNEAAGRLLRLPVGTVKSRLAQARALLRRRLTRRGITLTGAALAAVLAEEAAAEVPSLLLASTLQTTLLLASGEAATASVPAIALAEGVLKAMFATKLKIATVLLVTAGVLALGAVVLSCPALAQPAGAPPAQGSSQSAGATDPATKRAPASPHTEPGQTIAVSGRVLDPAGKPVRGAEVAAVAWQLLRFSSREREAVVGTRLTARTTSDTDGRFHLTVPQPPPATHRALCVLARAAGHGIGWANVAPNATRAEAEVRLLPEGTLAGRVVGLQGGPVAGVKIQALRMTWHQGDDWRVLPVPPDFVTATTDDRGRFTFRGVGRDLNVHLEINDVHCAPRELDVNTADADKAGHLVLGVAPPQVIEGRVVCEDTGKPMPSARLTVQTNRKSEQGYSIPVGLVDGKADGRGRFRVSANPGSGGFVVAYPPDGQPYLGGSTSFDWPKGTVKHEVVVKVPRGVLVHGKVTEAGSGKPLANASVEYQTNWFGRTLTAADGSYSLAVPPGPIHVLVTAATPDYIARPVGSAALELGKPGGDRLYYHAAAVIDLKKGEQPKELSFALRRGVTLKGTVVDSSGKPVKDAVLLVGGLRPPWEKWLSPIEVHDGRWELRGCDPQRTYHLLFVACPEKPGPGMTYEGVGSPGKLLLPKLIGPQNKLGAVVDVPAGKASGEPIAVHLLPTGSARLHLVDAQGKPCPPESMPSVELVVAPGPTFAEALKTGALAAETVYVATNAGEAGVPAKGDPAGTLTLHGLIPGATYRLRKPQQANVLKEFTAEAGKTLDVTVPVIP